eukprot:CAMPEP_0115312926 /NCGR_PEP_ID=MMETSP0270-20121206/76180_1 /TAXON_ID=71861 /ORGANISM="Scrippsiella trochoidea, Strain CCMP3099" /LENGTH=90 /DNA_ID=CAMNT_0002731959 /DNA_START=292 /DNA_END=564 /DNA_ORIENTATION=-
MVWKKASVASHIPLLERSEPARKKEPPGSSCWTKEYSCTMSRPSLTTCTPASSLPGTPADVVRAKAKAANAPTTGNGYPCGIIAEQTHHK